MVLRDQGLLGGRIIFGRGGSGGKKIQDFVKLGKFYAGLGHAGAAGEAEISARTLQAREAANYGADGGTVDVRNFRKIENHKNFLGVDELFDFLLEAAAIRAGMDAALHLKDSDALLGRSLSEMKNHGSAVPLEESGKTNVQKIIYEDGGCSSPS
jgi:hypothetical protein